MISKFYLFLQLINIILTYAMSTHVSVLNKESVGNCERFLFLLIKLRGVTSVKTAGGTSKLLSFIKLHFF
jgi:hypothetical protein